MALPKSVFKISSATATALGVTPFYDFDGNIVVNCDFGDDLEPADVQVTKYKSTQANIDNSILPPKRH